MRLTTVQPTAVMLLSRTCERLPEKVTKKCTRYFKEQDSIGNLCEVTILVGVSERI